MLLVFTGPSSSWWLVRVRVDPASPAGCEAEEFDSIPGVERASGPFGGAQCGAVVLDKYGALGKAQLGDQRCDVISSGFARLPVDGDPFQGTAMA